LSGEENRTSNLGDSRGGEPEDAGDDLPHVEEVDAKNAEKSEEQTGRVVEDGPGLHQVRLGIHAGIRNRSISQAVPRSPSVKSQMVTVICLP